MRCPGNVRFRCLTSTIYRMLGLRYCQCSLSAPKTSASRVLVVSVTCRLQPLRSSPSIAEQFLGPIRPSSSFSAVPVLSLADRESIRPSYTSTAAAAEGNGVASSSDEEWSVVNFYHLVKIHEPEKVSGLAQDFRRPESQHIMHACMHARVMPA